MQNQGHSPYYSIDGILSAMSTHNRHDVPPGIPHPGAYWHAGSGLHFGEYTIN